jgi:AraC-like DNA-binding protein
MIDHGALLAILLRHAPESKSFPTAIKGFRIVRRDMTNIIERCVLKPIALVTVQGKKRTVVGKIPYEYGAGHSFVIGMDIPGDSMVLEASPEKPYLSMIIELDAALIAQILAELPKDHADGQNVLAAAVSRTEPAVFEAFARLAVLLDEPEQIRFLAPMIIREIHYRLLTGPLGKHIMAINTLGTQSNKIASAIQWLESNYRNPVKIDELAEHVNMAVSTFHYNFKQYTTLSPLQFQKKLRLLEAQRLMLIEGADATSACYKVGYESPNQFNREYKRMFGNPPLKDIRNILQRTSQ